MYDPASHSSYEAAPTLRRRFQPVRTAARTLGWVFASGIALIVAVNTVTLPAWVAAHAFPLAIGTAGCVVAARWWRSGVRRQLRTSAGAKVAEFGGGVYGALAFATLLYLEALDMVGDVAEAGSLGAFFGSMGFGWVIQQAIESIGFAIQAALWPMYWLSVLGFRTVVLTAATLWALDFARRRGHLARLATWWRERRGGVAAAE
jgi:hypothetical protein